MDKLDSDKRRILLIEDSNINLRIMSRFLKGMDIQVTESSSGKEAIKNAIVKEFFMIFMCVSIPENIWYDSTKQIREQSIKNKETPIILVSSFSYQEKTEKMIECGINDVISKPLKKDEVVKLFSKYTDSDTEMSFEVFNIKEFESFYKEDDLKKEIISIFLSERESDVLKINEAFLSKDKDIIYDALHFMKGSFTYLRADNILGLTQQMLDLLKADKLSEALLLEKTFVQRYNLFNEELMQYINKIDIG